jgi:CubicO group peptidase (beta-lactamase class C family)
MNDVGMEDSPPVVTHDVRPNLAVGYAEPFDDRPWQAAHGLAPAAWSESGTADGTICATAGELAGYVRLLLNRGRHGGEPFLSEARAAATGPAGVSRPLPRRARFVRESERIEKERLQSAPRAAESEPSLLQEFQSVGLRSLLHCH